jgi:hypothetical protein
MSLLKKLTAEDAEERRTKKPEKNSAFSASPR